MVVESNILNQKKLKQEKMVDEQEYETKVAFHQRYNYAASSDMREELVDQMNEILDGFYETRYDELYHENAFRQVKGKQITIPVEELPKEMSDYILTLGRGYLCNSGLQFMGVDPTTIDLEIQQIWATDSKENDYNPPHSHAGLMSGVFYLKVPPQVLETNEEGVLNFLLAEDGYVDVSPYTTVRPNTQIFVNPEVGKFYIFPGWLKHSVNPFFGSGVRRAVSFNLVCPETSERKLTTFKEPYVKRKIEPEEIKTGEKNG